VKLGEGKFDFFLGFFVKEVGGWQRRGVAG
jgi:hypothetical protein